LYQFQANWYDNAEGISFCGMIFFEMRNIPLFVLLVFLCCSPFLVFFFFFFFLSNQREVIKVKKKIPNLAMAKKKLFNGLSNVPDMQSIDFFGTFSVTYFSNA
jgi:hypothetical protein